VISVTYPNQGGNLSYRCRRLFRFKALLIDSAVIEASGVNFISRKIEGRFQTALAVADLLVWCR
jgi:hypothetical protein